jgi:hypothetical protein
MGKTRVLAVLLLLLLVGSVSGQVSDRTAMDWTVDVTRWQAEVSEAVTGALRGHIIPANLTEISFALQAEGLSLADGEEDLQPQESGWSSGRGLRRPRTTLSS